MNEPNKKVFNPIVWSLPKGISANKEADMGQRIYHYITECKTTTSRGIELKPLASTVESILNAYDLFESHLIVHEGSYQMIDPFDV